MSDLLERVKRLTRTVEAIKQAEETKYRLRRLETAITEFLQTCKAGLREEVAKATALGSQIGASSEADSARRALADLRADFAQSELLEFELEKFEHCGSRLTALVGVLKDRNSAEWENIRGSVGEGAIALLAAAESLPQRAPSLLRSQLEELQRRVNVPSAEQLPAWIGRVTEFEEWRKELTDNDREVEELLVGITSRTGVALEGLELNPKWRKWLEDHGLVESLRVVLGRGSAQS